VCDLNAPSLPDFPFHDVCVFGGVFEYIQDVHRLVSRLRKTCHTVIISYCAAESARRRKIFTRRRKGWINDYTADELIGIFESAGFECVERHPWRKAIFFKFELQ
jgi:hypothetical protein